VDVVTREEAMEGGRKTNKDRFDIRQSTKREKLIYDDDK
jgi:hypothetical protein